MTRAENCIETSQFYTWMSDEGICHTQVKPNAVVTIKEAKENSKSVLSFTDFERFPLIVDAREISSMTKEARDFFSLKGRNSPVNAIALVISSPLSRVIGNFFIGLNKPRVPNKLFNSYEEARRWANLFIPAE